MRVTLSHITAAYHWLMTPMDGVELESLERRGTLGTCPTKIRELAWFDLADYEVEGVKTELLATDSSSCPWRDRFRYHVSSGDFPAGAFVQLDCSGLQIASPELTYWQMGKILPLGELQKLANAICGKCSYSVGEDGRLVKRRVPLTTIKRLERFVTQMGTSRSNPNAFRALKYIVENSESPMESCAAILLCTKRQYGGFGLPKPEMGHVVELDQDARRLTGTNVGRCDMYWSSADYDLEYDTSQEHSGPDAAERDSLRRSALRLMGVRVGELRRSQLVDADAFASTARMVAKELGHRIVRRSPELEFKYSQAYLDLRRQLFCWERSQAGLDSSPLRIGELDW